MRYFNTAGPCIAELHYMLPPEPHPTPEGLRQLDAYLDRLGLDHGTLVVFDRRLFCTTLHQTGTCV